MALNFLNNGYFAGKVGIGIENPVETLEVTGNTILGLGEDRPVKYDAGAGNFRITPNSGGFSTGYFFNISDGTFKGGLGALGSTGSLSYFWIGDDYNDATMVIKPNAGNVGIGTTTPAKKLEVVGTILSNTNGNRATGNINLGLTTNNVTKWSSITGTQYAHDTETEGFSIINGLSTSSLNAVYIGGALNEQNAATEIGFYTASNATTRTGSIKMKIVANGNVGIGTTSPGTRLHVVGSNMIFKVENASTTTNDYSQMLLQAGTATNYIWTQNQNSTNYGGAYSLNIYTQQAGPIAFFTNGNNERMRITSAGNVGIGTASPGTNLAMPDNYILGLGNSTDLRLYHDGSNSYINDIGTGGLIITSSQTTFQTSGANRMVIDSSGNVGIGTTTPQQKLDVVGRVRASYNTSNYYEIGASSAGGFVVGKSGGVETVNIRTYGDSHFNAGNVGIGTASPTAKLHVVGTGLFTGLVSGITPVAAANFVTKAYVDGSGGGTGPFLPLAGGTMTGTNGVIFPDNFNLKIGTGSDLKIFHNATDSFIINEVGNLKITNGANDKDIIFESDDGSGGTTPYFKLDGSAVNVRIDKPFLFTDNVKAEFGSSQDLQIYHDSTNSYSAVVDVGTGYLLLGTDGPFVLIGNSTATETYIKASNNDSVELYFNNARRLRTTTGGVFVEGEIKIDSALLDLQENTDVDTGTETVASVAIATYTAAFFDFVIKKTTNVRSGTVYACHDGTNVQFTETSTQDLGDTSDVTLSVDISGGNMRLRATTTSDDWSIKSLIRAI